MLDHKLVEELKNAPLLLLTIKDKEIIDHFNSLIPYSTGFEIECHYGQSYNEQSFRAIPDIMEVQNADYEQRYRIPTGIRGMICLYHISQQLKVNSELNLGSGIHYHIDCTEIWDGNLYDKTSLADNADWILEELDEWGYKGTYNKRGTNPGKGNWVRANGLKTLEFRIGEMTFDYPLLLKRITHCNSIVYRFKKIVNSNLNFDPSVPVYEAPDSGKILRYVKTVDLKNNRVNVLASKLAAIEKEAEDKKANEVKLEEEIIITRNRTHRI